MKKTSVKVIFGLHILLAVYSMSGIFSKLASGEKFLSPKFILYYACVIGLLGIYAIFWQQIIKRMPLTAAYANRAVTVVWGFIWGILFFQEKVTFGKILGIALVLIGIITFALADHKKEAE
jgi:multidrug transporter EmrE-like cation transporter